VTRIAVVGAGAIGGFLAAALAKSGLPVAVVARGTHLAAIRRKGIHVESDLGSFAARVAASHDLRELGDFDAVLLTFKAHQWGEFLPQLRSLAKSDASVVTLQNGVPFWYVREPPLRSVDPGGLIGSLFPDERVIGGVVHVSGEIVEPGRIRQSGGLRYILGDPRGGSSARVEALATNFRDAGLAVEIDRNIRATVWLKLVNNAGLNPMSVLRTTTIKPMLADPQARAEVRELMIEALHVGEALGAVSGADVDQRIEYAARLNDVKTSMLQDYESKRPLELDPIVGAAVELGHRCGVDVTSLERVYDRLALLSAAEAAK
jgi:2-dehydropantoate 2-reductase